jgi:hypothetical protein
MNILNADDGGDMSIQKLKKYIAYCRRYNFEFMRRLNMKFVLVNADLVYRKVRRKNYEINMLLCVMGRVFMNEKLERKQQFQLLFGRKIFVYQIFLSRFGFLIRQLEALVRISESLAKMRLAPFANETDVDEALRLFHVSTLSSAGSGNLAGKIFAFFRMIKLIVFDLIRYRRFYNT